MWFFFLWIVLLSFNKKKIMESTKKGFYAWSPRTSWPRELARACHGKAMSLTGTQFAFHK